MSNKLNLTDNEKRDIIKYLESGKPLPEKYRFLLFDTDREVELLWNGKTDEVENIVLPFQAIEHIDEPRSEEKITAQTTLFDTSGRQIKGWSNKLIWGDNKLILSSLKNGPLRKQIEAEGGLKLIYIDPPFDVGADFSMNIEIGDPAIGRQRESFTKKPSVIEEIAYRDTWGKGADSFIAMIYERLKLMHGLLADDGSIYVHCDWRVNSYMRLILDEIFGKSGYKNEITWEYQGSWVEPKTYYPRRSQKILFYSKSDNYLFNRIYEKEKTDKGVIKRWERYIEDGKIFGRNAPYEDGKFGPYLNKFEKENGRDPLPDDIIAEFQGRSVGDTWYVSVINPVSPENIKYPTQKPEKLLERIIKASSNEGDLVADFFCGSGTTLAVAEKLGRKWIGSDLGRFSIHTTRKRMIGVQRELKKAGKDFRAFEILNIGKYEREKFLGVNENLREEEKRIQRENKEKEFVKLILSAYKAEPVDSFNYFVGKKRDRLVAVGQIDTPVTNDFLEKIISECKEKKITKADVLGFDYEMGLDFEFAKKLGIDIQFKVIPAEVFDRKAVEKGQVKFYDVAYIEVKPIIKGRVNAKEIAIELSDFSVFYNQDNTGEVEEKLKSGGSKIVIENGQVIKIFKDLPAPRHVFSVYVIVCNNQSFYIGQTDNLIRRWEEHKQEKASWTKKYKPVEIIHYEHFDTRDEAVKREKALKTGFGRKWLKREFKKNNLNKWDENVARQAGKQTDIIEKEVLTKKWTDWIDYWSVDFDFESKKEIVRVVDEKTGEEKEEWTGSYIFENKWQSFRTKKDRTLELTSAFKEAQKGKMKIAIKVIDIFGNDTTKVIEINI